MNLFEETSDWETKLEPILQVYKGRKHPLEYKSTYQLMIMVILSAQDSDANINKIAPDFFTKYPNLTSIQKTDLETLMQSISKVRNYPSKAKWILDISKMLQNDNSIPLTMKELTSLKGIGRKSANVIMRETGQPAEGIIADLHVIRVAPRIGIISENKDGNKVEKDLMQALPKSIWSEIGMAISFLGREICRPKPKCEECLLKNICRYYEMQFN
ncbi:endonuclease III [Flavobacterium sp. GA093]|uniref:Endonuclease III n=1 Tax=Flavobacterium hydrocarbonoxydans TaxID=2683249 RepID=A0A6I4NR75_9FLAO|nr:endonuclease III [Flavobacterium hydrocarbonoxydans]MWB96926.1 endonuclease III [Flavobacterium hydrocarbonoxydans]